MRLIVTLLLLPYIAYLLHSHLTAPSTILKNTNNKNILITGASQGIGKSLVTEYARLGAKNILILSRSSTKLQVVADENEANYPNTKIHVIPADLSSYSNCEDAVQRSLSALGDEGLDIVVLNHITDSGYGPFFESSSSGEIISSKSASVDAILTVNFMSYVHLTSLLMPSLMVSEGGGTLSVVSSLASIVGTPNTAVYGASKAAVRNFFDALRIEITYGYNAKFKAKNESVSITLSHIGATETEGSLKIRHMLSSQVEWGKPSDAARAIVEGAALRKRESYHPFHLVYPAVWLNRIVPKVFDMILWGTTA